MKRFVCMVCAALLFAACTKEIEDVPSLPVTGEEVPVTLNWSVAGMAAGDETTRVVMTEGRSNPASRVIPSDMESGQAYDDGYPAIHNMWIIQFDDDTPQARMVGAPRFLSVADGDLELGGEGDYPLETSIPLVGVPDNCYTLFVANIRQGSTYNWNLTSESTFSDVITRVKTIQNEDGAFEDFTALPDGTRTLLMSAVTTSKVESGMMLEPLFTRNVAKVTLNLTLSNADMTIKSVRLRNVSSRIVFADAALLYNGVTTSTVFPVSTSLIDYEPITDASVMPEFEQTSTFSWYIPRNQQGINTHSTSPKNKTVFAPANATYIEIVAVKDGTTPATSIFRVYPGADMISDFNLTTNHIYTVGLNVRDIGTDPADSRVETFSSVVDYGGSGTPASRSNSFIINPAPVAGGIVRTYLVGVHQVNRFWGDDTEGYGDEPDNVIGEDDEWIVDLIWSDHPNLFTTDEGSTTAIKLLRNYPGSVPGGGKGPDQVFALSVPPALPVGNFVLGLKKAGLNNPYLWSWHFWVTDYNPDTFNRSLVENDTYIYIVPGGQVERYVPGPTAGETNNGFLWTESGLYAGRVMMDRNLGAVENFFSVTPNLSKRGFIYYQFGRKDPIPGTYALTVGASTGMSGSTIPSAVGPVSIAESVSHPWIFYTHPSGGKTNWTNEVIESNYLWNDPKITSFAVGKSIYDPCPVGWRLPIAGTWNDFARVTTDSKLITVANELRDLGWNFGRGIGTVDATVTGHRYWPGTTIDEPAGGRIWYPATGTRNGGNNGIANSVGTNVLYWSSTPGNDAQAPTLNGGGTSVFPNRGAGRSSGAPVRCISE